MPVGPCVAVARAWTPATRQMRQEVEFRFYEGRSEGPQRPERNRPALLQGGGEALMFGDSGGR